MAFRVSFFFVQQTAKSGGWSESYWNGAADLTSVTLRASILGGVLSAVHGHTTYITTIRFSEVGAFRRVQVGTTNDTFNPQSGNSIVSDYPTTALLLRLQSAPNYVVNQWVRGIPDAQVSGGGFYVPTGDYVNRANALFGVLTSGSQQWSMRVQDKSTPIKAVFAISQTGVVTVPNHGYFDGDYIRISRVKGYAAANKIWRISIIDANSFQLLFWTNPSTGTVMTGNPTAQKQVKTLVQVSTAQFVRATEHKVGRPFALLSGRRKTRR